MATFSYEDAVQAGDQQPTTFSFEEATRKPKAIGSAANADFLREELRNADPFTRNLAGAGTALSDTWEGLKQFFNKGDKEQIANNKIIAEEAPIGHMAGELAMLAQPLAAVGPSVKAAGAAGAVIGALRPVEGEGLDFLGNKLKSAAVEAGVTAAGQKITNAAGGYVADKLADLATKKALNTTRDQTVKDALDARLSVTPAAVNPSWLNSLKESIGGKAATAQTVSNRNEPKIAALIREDLHLAPDAPLTGDTLRAAREQAYAVGYKPVTDVPAINWDPQFVNELKTLSPASAGGAVRSPGHAEIGELVDSLANRGQWTGEQLVQDIRQLRENANARFAGNATDAERDLARAEKKAANMLEDLAQRNIAVQGGNPDAVALFREARQYIAKTHDVERAIVQGSGNVDARKLGSMYQKNPDRFSGSLETVAAFANNFRNSVQPSAKVQGPNVSALNAALGMFGGAAGFAAGSGNNPTLAGAAGAVLPFIVRPAVRAQMLSRRSQNRLLDMYRLGAPTVAANRLLKYAPVGSAVLGAEALR